MHVMQYLLFIMTQVNIIYVSAQPSRLLKRRPIAIIATKQQYYRAIVVVIVSVVAAAAPINAHCRRAQNAPQLR